MENKTIENKKCSEEEGCISGVSPKGEFKICFSGDGSNENQLCWVGIKHFKVFKEDGAKQGA